jgi:AcrR family transcriptional regulator
VPRAGLSPDAVVDVALDIVDADGPAALTLSAVAARAGVAIPSLYNHVGSLAELRQLLTQRVLQELTARIAKAALGRSGEDALRALMHTYRAYVIEHPGRYAAMVQAPDPDPRVSAAADQLLDIVLAVLGGNQLHGSNAIHAARALRAAAHGFAVLETAAGFGLPENLDTSYDLLIQMLINGLPLARSLQEHQ